MIQRNIAFDYLRSLAILLIAILHSWSLLDMDIPEYGVMCYLYRSIVNTGVPLFVLISGALVLSSPITSIATFFKKRLTRVLIPFLIWATAIYILQIVRHQYSDISSIADGLRSWIPYLLNNQVNEFHWFVHMMIALYILTPVLQRVVHLQEGKRLCEYMMVVIVTCLVLKWTFPQIFILRYSSSLLSYIGLYLAGYYISQYGIFFHAAPWIYGAMSMLLYVIDVVTCCPNALLTQMTAVAIFATILSLHLRCPLPYSSAIVNLSRYSYLIYLVHIPLLCVVYLFAHIQAPQGWMPVVVGIGVVAVCATGCRILDLVPGKWKTYLGISK